MTSLLKKIPVPLILLAILGGWTVVNEGPKFLWGANVERHSSDMGRICLGATTLGHIANPITWFLAPPDSYFYVAPRQVSEYQDQKGIWLVQLYRVRWREGQTASAYVFDVNREAVAYLGDAEMDSPQEIAEEFENPDWSALRDLGNNVWAKNAIDWIQNGKSSTADYCD